MKKIIIPISLLFVSGLLSAQATNTENYIRSRTYLEPVTDSSNTAKQIQTVQYFDGLGNPKQIVNVKASPTEKDLVTTIPYDGFGRQIDSWLPAPMSTLNGGIQSGVDGAAQAYHNDNKTFSHKNFENSPLDRILSQVQPGTSWQGNPIQFSYSANVYGEVKKYIATFDYTTFTSSITLSTTGYASGELYKNTVTDEDGNATIEFKNTEGKVLLIRKVVSATENADTYYVYNDYNQLAYVISPLASIANTIDTTALNNLCFQYKYDSRNRLVEKKLPGKGWEYMVYDKQDRLALTQDANMGASKQWLFTKYDQYGRRTYTGIYTSLENYGSSGRISEQTNVDSKGANNVARLTTIGLTSTGIDVYYDNSVNSSYPSSITKLTGVNYYDTYPYYSFNPAFPPDVLNETTLTDAASSESRSTKGLLVMGLIKNIEDDNWTKNYTYFDKKGRVIGTYSINHLGGRTKVDSKLDFAGIVQKTVTTHKRLNTDTDRVITENFTYDLQNRLLTHTHQVDSNSVEYLNQNAYNELSQIINKKVGGTVATNPLQDITYNYNIHGWLTKINDPKNLNGKLFGYEIKYNQIEGLQTPDALDTGLQVLPKYNGNIAEVDWRTSTTSNDYQRRYGYVYDKLNRLSAGFYQREDNPSAKEYFEKIVYDVNGNITNLKRSASSDGNTTAGLIDNLTYEYFNNNLSNRLKLVTDSSTDYRGYPEASGNEIGYDDNGNITSQVDKGILNIYYNFLNLPDNLKFDNTYIIRNLFGGTTETRNITTKYVFRADGTKISKLYTYGVARNQSEAYKMTEYVDGFQYEMEGSSVILPRILKFVPTAEGYYNFENNKYIYNYSDQLGNVRLSFFNNGSGAGVLEENNYYPFGLKHEGYNYSAGNLSYQYKYNGKELQTESGMYDYGARFYMPDLGRWGVIDAMSEKYRRHSPYNYAINNPIKFTDPDGNDPLYGQEAIDTFLRLKDWYQKNGTNDIEWKDTDKKVEGYTNLGKTFQFGSSIPEDGGTGYIDRMYYLHANGSATVKTGDNQTTILHAEGGETLYIIAGGTITTSATSVNGLAVQASFTFAPLIVPGFTMAAGYVKDSYGVGKRYYYFGKANGLMFGAGVDFIPVKATNPDRLFHTEDFGGYGNSYSAGFGPSLNTGGSTDKNMTFKQNINPNAWGRNKNGYTTVGSGFGVGLDFGAVWTRTNTILEQ